MSDAKMDLTPDQIKGRDDEARRCLKKALEAAVKIDAGAAANAKALTELTQDQLLARALLHMYKVMGQATEQASLASPSDKGDQGSGCDYFQNGGKMNVGDIGD